MEFIKKIIFSYYLWRFRLPRDVILFALEKNPNRPALTGPRGTLTFDQLRQRIGALCGLWRCTHALGQDHGFFPWADPGAALF